MLIVEGTIPVQEVFTTAPTQSPAEAVKQFLSEHPLARVEKVGDQFVRGVCRCGTPVLQNDTGYTYDTDTEAYSCPSCSKKGKQAS